MPRRRRAGVLALAALLSIVPSGTGRAETSSPGEPAPFERYLDALWLAHERAGREVPYRDLVYSSIQGMLRTLDPHTSFLPPAVYSRLRARQRESFFGVGILVSIRAGRVTVIAPIDGTPAAALGLRSGDVIDAIDGESTEELSLTEAVERIQGPEGTEVQLTILRPGLDEPLLVTAPRAEIPQDTVRYAYMITPEVGYLRVTEFGQATGAEVERALTELRRAGMTRLVLDLRNNGGGLLDQAIAVADLLLPPGSLIVETRGRLRESRREFHDGGDEPDPELGMPLVVLVNRGTASAAEILAGALQDHDLGLIVGTPTWGKGLVQTVYSLSWGAGLALTTARYHTPSGRAIQRDYTSYHDYYNPEARDHRVGEFATDLGRPVFGGGGITPDVLLEPPALPEKLLPLVARNAFFDFAVDYHRRRPVTRETWQPPPDLLESFSKWLRERGSVAAAAPDPLAGPEARNYARRQIHADIFNAAFGTEAAHRVLAGGDPLIQEALGRLDGAGDLLARRAALGERASARRTPPAAEGGRELEPVAVPQAPDSWPLELRAGSALVRAKLLTAGGDFESALEAYASFLELAPDSAFGRLLLASFHTDLARWSRTPAVRKRHLDMAAREVAEAKRLGADNPEVQRGLANLRRRIEALQP